ncbi:MULTISPECIES: NAD(P)-dependent oxidoreductase [unclassified Polynucleobacter]|uniref:NAD(P)-dependent oxidoreductase n=1 Tax=unclassified Polynucleobacter TaxID=2640945 RepID=UPI002491DC01|nr:MULTISPECIES: NAD(P)-dependent oxidoreductase [unclassified Polynucleobacter]
MNILFIGIGKMGLPMATHLKNAGHELKVIDINPQQISLAKQNGLIVGNEDDYTWANWIITSMPNDQAFLEVAKQISLKASKNTIYVDTSTISISASSQAAVWLNESQIDYLRVAVSGNNHMAIAAQLTVLSSGKKEIYDQAHCLLTCWGPKVIYLGQQEQARLMKLVVNLMIAQTSAMLAEGLTLGRLGNLDWQDMWEVITNSAVGSPIMKAKMAQLGKPLGDRDFSPTFTVEQMIKDLSLINQAAQEFGSPIEQTQTTLDWMKQATQDGEGQLDYAAIIRVLERKAKLSN